MARLAQKYKTEIRKTLQDRYKYKNVNQIPVLQKVVVNMGVGEVTQNSKAIDAALQDLVQITGQRPSVRRAKKSIANFKLRQGQPIGLTCTLRHQRMYEFIDRLVSIALPRVRDFRGIPKNSFDGRGNYSLGIKEQTIFPEINIEKSTPRGFSITFVTTAKTNEESFALLKELGLPFRH